MTTSTCTCGEKFRTAEDFRDHLPCPAGTPFTRLQKAVAAYVEQYGVEHEDGCPEDDTCECPLVQALNTALGKADVSEWEDKVDEWSAAINEAFPTRSGSHATYATAMQMVGHRHSKGELVSLVNWLLLRIEQKDKMLEDIHAKYCDGIDCEMCEHGVKKP